MDEWMSGGMNENGAGRWVGFFVPHPGGMDCVSHGAGITQIRILAQRRQVAENFLFFGETIANLGLGLTWG
jgi:hypothetical protein